MGVVILSTKIPPSRPGGFGALGARSDDSAGHSKYLPVSSAGSNSGKAVGRPPVLLMISLIINSLVPVAVIVLIGFVGDAEQHVIGIVFGMFFSVILLGLFRQSLDKRRGDGRFSDWRISSTKLSTMFSVLAWLLGGVNLFIVCLEFSRRFT